MLKSMRRTEHMIARAVAVVGLLTTLVYLLWRVSFSLVGTDLWLSIPVVLVEISGFVGGAILVWALWPRLDQHRERQFGAPAAGADAVVVAVAVDVVVRVQGQTEHELRATLIALRAVASVERVVVVDAATDRTDCGGLAAAAAAVRTPRFLLLDAGDVPTTDIVTRLTRPFVDESVAVVQGLGICCADDSIEHGPDGRHDLTFERAALNPALGTRGCAFWTGSGSLVSRDALREALAAADLAGSATSLGAQWEVSSELLAAGWRIVAPVDVAVVAHRVEHAESVVYSDRRARVRTACQLVAHRRRRRHSAAQRMAILAWCVRPLSGMRRAAFLAVLVLALYAGSSPFDAPARVMLAAWLPGFVATSVGLSLLSGWRLHPGDRTRWSLLSMGPACSSWRSTVAPLTATSRAQFGAGIVVAVTALCTVLVLRGISDLFTHELGPLPREVLLGLIVVALWTLAVALDVLRMLARRTQVRRTARVGSSLSAVLGQHSAKIIDLTSCGAGLFTQTTLAIGERVRLVSSIPTSTGVAQVDVLCDVRTVAAVAGGCWRIGVEFGEVDELLESALAEVCLVEPMWERLGVMPGSSLCEARRVDLVRTSIDGSFDDDSFIGRGTLRVLALVASIGAVGSSVAGNSSWLMWVVVAFSAALGGSLLLALISTRIGQASSSFSPDLAIR
jgi:hypothetical protein